MTTPWDAEKIGLTRAHADRVMVWLQEAIEDYARVSVVHAMKETPEGRLVSSVVAAIAFISRNRPAHPPSPDYVRGQELTRQECADALRGLDGVFQFASIHGWTTPNPKIVRLVEWLRSRSLPLEDAGEGELGCTCPTCGGDGTALCHASVSVEPRGRFIDRVAAAIPWCNDPACEASGGCHVHRLAVENVLDRFLRRPYPAAQKTPGPRPHFWSDELTDKYEDEHPVTEEPPPDAGHNEGEG